MIRMLLRFGIWQARFHAGRVRRILPADRRFKGGEHGRRRAALRASTNKVCPRVGRAATAEAHIDNYRPGKLSGWRWVNNPEDPAADFCKVPGASCTSSRTIARCRRHILAAVSGATRRLRYAYFVRTGCDGDRRPAKSPPSTRPMTWPPAAATPRRPQGEDDAALVAFVHALPVEAPRSIHLADPDDVSDDAIRAAESGGAMLNSRRSAPRRPRTGRVT